MQKSVAYLGPEGTFSHILVRQRFGTRLPLVPSSTIEGVFDHVLSNPGTLGLVPIENSSGGTVYDTVDLLIRHSGKVFIHEELALDIRIALLGRSKTNITTVFSHFTQLKHHAAWLKARLPKARLRTVTSTAVAAEKAVSNASFAALASPGAAEVYGLQILEIPETDKAVNQTNFFVIGSKAIATTPAKKKKTGLVAVLPNICGSLHRFLGPFARQQVSLTRIVSRPVPGQPQTYVFFLEIDGGPDDPAVVKALKRAASLASSLTPLGTFPTTKRYKS